ncbi:helix-turn-helix domain-containing protein (plasmid) [Skermanella sp. TT6]|uniref:Helix-turn-helix domain-containing protein n=1 Tax=Skermanella cutis TaxID=2775420 RepID=A0ABX7BEL0_9PROT|nr:IclR family transcriptional regulator C-terminal domain-containing protein [Skermanella sp. TT6]QQP92833.1 helix-turn-helix domain-containing protein [Skermanella sp. TT6]
MVSSARNAESASDPEKIGSGDRKGGKSEPEAFVRAFAKGLSVITAFGQGSPATIADISRASGLDRAGARRILLTLEQLGYVRMEGRKFSLTPRVLTLGYLYLSSLPFWSIAQPVMEELVADLQETCSMGVLDGDDVVYVLRVPARRFLTFDPSIGGRTPAHIHSMGRVLLAAQPPEMVEGYIARTPLKAYTRHTVTDPDELRRGIADDRGNGWCFVSEQYEDGMCGIAVPVLNAQGMAIAAINVSMVVSGNVRQRAIDEVLPKLRLAARHIGGRMR